MSLDIQQFSTDPVLRDVQTTFLESLANRDVEIPEHVDVSFQFSFSKLGRNSTDLDVSLADLPRSRRS